jgi:hydrophobe/amphiphile efflux-3 (HAE3) family protein
MWRNHQVYLSNRQGVIRIKLVSKLVNKFPRLIIAIVIVATIVFGVFAVRIDRQSDLSGSIPNDHPRLQEYAAFTEEFGSNRSVVVVACADDIFAPQSMQAIDRITNNLTELPFVVSVSSLTNMVDMQGTPDGLVSGPIIPQLPQSQAESDQLRSSILSNPWYNGNMVSADAQSTLILVNLEYVSVFEESKQMLDEIIAAVDAANDGLEVHYAGTIVMEQQINRFLSTDVLLLIPVVVFCIIIVLFLTLRSWQGVLLPLVTVLVSVVWTLGIMSMLGRPLSFLGYVLPVLLVAVGSAYGIHIVARYQEGMRHGMSGKEAVDSSISSTGAAVWMAALTTVAGFGSLVFSKMEMFKDFGVFSALGVIISFLISITLIPALLLLLPDKPAKEVAPTEKPKRRNGFISWAENTLGRMAGWSAKHYGLVSIIVLVLVIVAILGWPHLTTTFDPSDFLPIKSDHRVAEQIVNDGFGGSVELDVLIKGDLNDPAFLKNLVAMQDAIAAMGLQRPLSIADLLIKTNRALNNDDPQYAVIPEDPGVIPQLLFLLSLSGSPDEMLRFMNFDQTEARLAIRVSNVMHTTDRAALLTKIEDLAGSVFGADASVKVTGSPIIEMVMMDIIREEQVQNIAISLVSVLLIVVIFFRSFIAGASCISPIVATVVLIFGFMGWAGIPLNTATAIIASLATGIGVDYSIHFYQRYKEERGRGLSMEEAFAETGRTSGLAIISNALSVGSGFAVLLLSGLTIFRSFGGMLALSMLLTAFGSITLLPAVIKLYARVFKDKMLLKRKEEDHNV